MVILASSYVFKLMDPYKPTFGCTIPTVRLVEIQEKEIASRSGLLVGDVIVAINGKDIHELTRNEVEELILSPPGYTLDLRVKRSFITFNIELKLSYAPKETVFGQWINPDIYYLKIDRFLVHTADELSQVLQRLEHNAALKVSAYIIDLRGNPGGNIKAAVNSSELFLYQGVIAYTVNMEGKIQNLYTAHENEHDIEVSKKVVVLIDKHTASAAELFAAALQDNARALIVGRNSYGKDTVQDFIELETGGAIKLTTAKYLTSSGRTVHKRGIQPDVQVESSSIFMDIATILTFKEPGKLIHCDQKNSITYSDDKDISLAVEIMRSSISPLEFRQKSR